MPGSEYIIKYISDMSEAMTGARRLEQVNRDMAQTISTDFTKATRVIGTSLNKVSDTPIKLKGGEEAIKTVSQLGTVIQTSDGRFKEFTKTQTFIDGQLQKTSGSLKDVTGQFGKTAVETAKASKNTLTMGENMARLAKRALLTIPVWLALRGAIMGTISSIKNSLAGIIQFDKALQKLKKSLQGTTEEIERNFNTARDAIARFSIETGVSVNSITKAIQRFATVGFDFETAMSAGLDATRLSILLFGDAEHTANAFARSLRVLVTDINDTKRSQEEIAGAMALTSELYETNAFELSELSTGLEKFAGTAKSMGFTLEETLVLLAGLSTRGLNAERAGTLLRTSTLKLAQNLSNVSKVLGVQINPQLESTFQIFMKVVNAIAELKKGSQTISVDVAGAVKELFGGTRGGEPILDIIADIDKVNEAFKGYLAVKPDIGKFHNDVKAMTDTLDRQVEIYHNLNKQIGMAFLTGVTGAEDFKSSIKVINDVLSTMLKKSERWGTLWTSFGQIISLDKEASDKTLNDYFDRVEDRVLARFVKLSTEAQRGFEKGLSTAKLDETFEELAQLRFDIQTSDIDQNYLKQVGFLEDSFIKIASQAKDISDSSKNESSMQEAINRIISERVDFQKNEEFLQSELKAKGLDILEIEQAILQIREANALTTTEEISEQTQLVEHLKRIQGIELERASAKGLINNQLEYLKLQGANNLQLLEQQIALEKTYNINQDKLSLLQNEIGLQKEITAEKEKQENLSSDSLKLFQIAQKYGRGTAKNVAEFIKKDSKIPITAIERGGSLSRFSDIINEFFGNIVQQRQAERYFYEGRGRGIPISERGINIQEVRRLPIESIRLPDIKTNIGEIRVDIKQALSKENLSQQIVDEIVNAIQNNDKIQQAIDEKIESY